MKRIVYLVLFVSISVTSVHAQVTIGSLSAPSKGALLDLKSDSLGFLPPRVKLTELIQPDPLPLHVEGIVVFNISTSLPQGLYFNTGTQWKRLLTATDLSEKWFYMPSFALDVSENPDGKPREKNLYEEFQKQFNKPVLSPGASNPVLSVLPKASDLYYYVTGYDEKVFKDISINENGIMKYTVTGVASDATYLNIVFAVKQLIN